MASAKECGARYTDNLQEAGSGSRASGYLVCSIEKCPLSSDGYFVSAYSEGLTSVPSVRLPQDEVVQKVRAQMDEGCLYFIETGEHAPNEMLPRALRKPASPIPILE